MMEIRATSEGAEKTYGCFGGSTKQANSRLERNNVRPSDTVEFSKEGREALEKSEELSREEQISSKSKGVKILKKDSKYKINFENVAYVYRAIKIGYIDIGG